MIYMGKKRAASFKNSGPLTQTSGPDQNGPLRPTHSKPRNGREKSGPRKIGPLGPLQKAGRDCDGPHTGPQDFRDHHFSPPNQRKPPVRNTAWTRAVFTQPRKGLLKTGPSAHKKEKHMENLTEKQCPHCGKTTYYTLTPSKHTWDAQPLPPNWAAIHAATGHHIAAITGHPHHWKLWTIRNHHDLPTPSDTNHAQHWLTEHNCGTPNYPPPTTPINEIEPPPLGQGDPPD